MSQIKADLLKRINESVVRKKQLAKEVSREKTIAYWVAEFFIEYSKVKRLETDGDNTFSALAISKLTIQLRNLDRKCNVIFKDQREDAESPVVEIHWSSQYSATNNCEDVMAFDASSAFFQSAIEGI